MNMNYQKELETIINKLQDRSPTLLLHSCCAPCSSYVLEYLSQYFKITVYYYNPNISEEEEYRKRVAEQKRLIQQMNLEWSKIPQEESPIEEQVKEHEETGKRNFITFQEGPYDSKAFFQAVKGLEKCKEGGERCRKCFQLRLEQTAKEAQAQGFDYFTTTLTISPLKDAEALNEIGQQIVEQYRKQIQEKVQEESGIRQSHAVSRLRYLPSDFKKRNGYKRSIELSKEYDLYRQDYCGCIFSKLQREEEKKKLDTADADV